MIVAARELVAARTRFRHQGRTMTGVDCIGTAAFAFRSIGRNIEDMPAYSREPQGKKLERGLEFNLGPPIEKCDMQVGDVVLMTFEGEPSHVGILGDYLYGGLSLIHGYLRAKRVIEHRLDQIWFDRIIKVYRP